ncbi:MAG: endolytic transglycosylase MltG [Sphaerochaetaceae bacterium]|nr:endolytic transglycosylase MltG [Sphaerochaetaceae bacterium]
MEDSKSKKGEKLSSSGPKKRGLPSSGTDVFKKKPTLNDDAIKNSKTEKSWKQGTLFTEGDGKSNTKRQKKAEHSEKKERVAVKKDKTAPKTQTPKKTAKKTESVSSKREELSRAKTAHKGKTSSTEVKHDVKKNAKKPSASKTKVESHKKDKKTAAKTGSSKSTSVRHDTKATSQGKKDEKPKRKIAKTGAVRSKDAKVAASKKSNKDKSVAKIPKSAGEKRSSSLKMKIAAPFLIGLSIFLILFIAYLGRRSYLDKMAVQTSSIEQNLLKSDAKDTEDFIQASKIDEVKEIIKPSETGDAFQSFELVIEKGMSAKNVAYLISLSGFFDEESALNYMIDNNIASKINIGTYYLTPSMTMEDVAEMITVKSNLSVKIYPGMTLNQIEDVLVKRNLIDEGKFVDACTSICDRYGLTFVEGWFLAGTYKIDESFDVDELALNMYYAMLNALSPYLSDIASSSYSVEQTLIIASLIQAETNDVNQMPLISQVIHNRLLSDMPLGINATTCYELGVYSSDIDQSVYDEITDYNTRRKKGLVPSGICSISADALKAAVHPTPGDYLYYNHQKDGTMLMAKTYEQHLLNIEEDK